MVGTRVVLETKILAVDKYIILNLNAFIFRNCLLIIPDKISLVGLMHVQGNARDLSYGDSICRNFIGGRPGYKMTSQLDIWGQHDLSKLSSHNASYHNKTPSDVLETKLKTRVAIVKNSEFSTCDISKNETISSTEQSPLNYITQKDENIDSEKVKEVKLQPKICHRCKLVIESTPICTVDEFSWHEECLSCFQCGSSFNLKCFLHRGILLCKEHYNKIRSRCDGCGLSIDERELKVPARHEDSSYIFHTKCSVCVTCKRSLQEENCYFINESCLQGNTILLQCFNCPELKMKQLHSTECDVMANTSPAMSSDVTDLTPKSPSCVLSPKSEYDDDTMMSSEEDYLVYNVESFKEEKEEIKKNVSEMEEKDKKGVKRPRTILSASQRNIFKNVFETTQKPNKKQREELAKNTGLTARVVQVWFQNQRAKIKKLSKRQQSHGAASVDPQNALAYHGYDPFALKLSASQSGSDMMPASQFQHFSRHPHLLLQEPPYQHPDSEKWEYSTQDSSRHPNQISYSCIYQSLSSTSELRMASSSFPTSLSCDLVASADVRIGETGVYPRNTFDQTDDVLYEASHDAILNNSRDGSEPTTSYSCMGQNIASSINDLCLMQNSYIS